MKTKIKHGLLTGLFILTVTFNAKSQIAISNVSEIEKIKRGTTYIAMKDPGSEQVQEYIKVLKSNWTISKCEIIPFSEIDKYLSPESSFFTIGGFEKIVQGSNYYTVTHIYMELWTCEEKYFKSKKKQKEFENSDKIQVARMELFTDYKTSKSAKNIFDLDFDGNGHIRNWGPGILKNQIQTLTSYLNNSQERRVYGGIINPVELKNLTKEVLYVPDYVLIKFDKRTGDETKKHDEKEIFEDYSLKYKLITMEGLNQKILTDQKPFYYLTYIKSATDKFITVTNSVTGEIIYSKYSPLSYNIDSGDLKDLQKKVFHD